MLRSAVARLSAVRSGNAIMSGLLAQPVTSLCNYNCSTCRWVAEATGLRRYQRSPASSFGSHTVAATANPRSAAQPEEVLTPYAATAVSAEWRQPSTALDAQAISDALNLTWLTHWQHAEEQRQFRRQVFESTRGRQVQRQQWLRDALSDAELSSDDDVEMRIVNGRFSMAAEQRAAGSSSAGAGRRSSSGDDSSEEMDDLTWLASHPEALGQSAGEGDSAAALATWTQQAAEKSADASAVQLRVGGESVSVRPLWIAVYQPEGSTTARLFESAAPLQADIVDRLRVDLTPFCSIDGLEFGAFADMQRAPWTNYFVGLVGDVAVEEHDILWPNQILHRDRVLYNVRSAADVARFLADPRREDVLEHVANLMRLTEERRYRRGWAWHMLVSRWGKPTLDKLKIKLP